MEDEERRRKIEHGRAIVAAWRRSRAAVAMEDEERQRKIEYGRAIVAAWRLSQQADAMEDEERRRKIEYARAKLAQYRQREARCVGQTTKKSKKVSSCKQDKHRSNINECTNEVFKNVSQGVETNENSDSTEMRILPSGQANKHNQVLDEVSETLQSSTHSTTAEELVLVKQQVHVQHQQLEEQNHLLTDYQKKEEELKTEVTFLQEKIKIHEQQTDGAKLEFVEENVAEEESGIFSACSQAGLQNTDTHINHERELSSLPESEDSKEHEKQLQGLENPVNALEQQLKATEAHYGTQIPMVQGSVETIHGQSAHPSVDSVVFKDNDSQKTVCRGNSRPDHVIIVIEMDEMPESFTQNQEKTESFSYLHELNEHVQEQFRTREQPAVDLNEAECIVDGYSDEKILLEREIQEKACIVGHIDQELLCMSGRLPKLEEEQQQIQEERALLSRQKEAMGGGAGPVEQQTLNKGHMEQEQLHTVPMESVGMAADELQADALQPEDVSAQDSSELLKTLTPVGGLKENCKGYRCQEAQLLTLEQGKSKPELLQKKINILQILLVEKIAEATVSQAQLEAFQQYVKYLQEKRTSELEMTDRYNVNPLTGDNTVLDIYTLSMRLEQLENQVAEMRSSFIAEKKQLEITKKRVSNIENILKLQMPLDEDTTKRQEIKENERSLQDLDISETRVDVIHASGDRGFLDELEALGARSVSHKERDRYKEQAYSHEELLGSEYGTPVECLQTSDRRTVSAENHTLNTQINGRKMTVTREQDTSSQSVCMSTSMDLQPAGSIQFVAP